MSDNEREKMLAEIIKIASELDEIGQVACLQYVKAWVDKNNVDKMSKKQN